MCLIAFLSEVSAPFQAFLDDAMSDASAGCASPLLLLDINMVSDWDSSDEASYANRSTKRVKRSTPGANIDDGLTFVSVCPYYWMRATIALLTENWEFA